ncbi:MAG TPA: 2Fe-2S iron-sulfur cluster-binding protein [Nitrososphaerales archaeon]|nr:2Fe-2S iron-sulfur cluster-binding protein [Nitrososphaerales archaeon]
MNSETLTIDVFRSDPVTEDKPSFIKYKIPLSGQMTVLDALQYARGQIDSTLVINYSCQKQRCGSCAMKIDGKISLACYTPVRDGQKISPLPGFRVSKDLVVDWSPYEEKMQELLPTLPEKSSRRVSKREEELSESASTCIRCFSCVGACPTVDVKESIGFTGPAISVMLASHMDREDASKNFLSSIVKSNLEYCTRCYACNSVCPAEINIVGCIQELQQISGSSNSGTKRLNEMTSGYF